MPRRVSARCRIVATVTARAGLIDEDVHDTIHVTIPVEHAQVVLGHDLAMAVGAVC